MADIAYTSLLLALVASIYSAVAFFSGARTGRVVLLDSARNALIAVCGLTTISVGILLGSILSHNFGLEYVASYTSRSMSLVYLVTALWAGNSGSLLFWAWVLSIFAVVAMLRMRKTNRELTQYASAIVMLTQVLFLLLLISVSNPFQQLASPPPDGRGLNPLLENPGMIIHPPLLLAGYVGFTIPFALAVAAMITGRLSDEWIIAARRWTIIAWLFLGIGNVIGMWWAYVELGWGGYWAWDPVENAGLMPWLVGTAFLHSIMIQKRKGMLKVWNLVLIILAFNLAIFGTFITRSGALQSVHTFQDFALGPFFMIFLAISFFGSMSLVYYRYRELKSGVEMESLVSRESAFLLNNILLVGTTFAILLGTMFPAIVEAVRGVKITVGPAFFNRVNGPLFMVIILLVGICTLIGWGRPSGKTLVRRLWLPLAVAVVLGIVLGVGVIRERNAVLAFSVCAFVVVAILYDWSRSIRARHQAKGVNYVRAFFGLLNASRQRYGGYLVHISIVMMAVGVVGSSFFGVDKEATLKPGESMTLNNYTLTFVNKETYQTSTRSVVTATVSVRDQGNLLGRLTPEKYFDQNFDQPVTEVAIRSTPKEDLYVILMGWSQDGSTSFKVLVNPLVMWIWVGGGLMLLGGIIVFWPERKKVTGDLAEGVSGDDTGGTSDDAVR